jgi:hypothetical protein
MENPDKYHHVSNKAKVKKVSTGRFNITPVDPEGSLNALGPFLKTSQILVESGRFNIKMGPDQKKKSKTEYHDIPFGAEIKKIETGRFSITPVGDGSLNFLGPVKKKSTVTYKKGKINVRKGPHLKRHNSIGGRATKRKTHSSKRKSRRNKRYIV